MLRITHLAIVFVSVWPQGEGSASRSNAREPRQALDLVAARVRKKVALLLLFGLCVACTHIAARKIGVHFALFCVLMVAAMNAVKVPRRCSVAVRGKPNKHQRTQAHGDCLLP